MSTDDFDDWARRQTSDLSDVEQDDGWPMPSPPGEIWPMPTLAELAEMPSSDIRKEIERVLKTPNIQPFIDRHKRMDSFTANEALEISERIIIKQAETIHYQKATISEQKATIQTYRWIIAGMAVWMVAAVVMLWVMR